MSNKLNTNPSDYVDEYNGLMYLINMVINNKINTCELVRVVAINPDNTIDAIPIISDVDADENPITPTPIYGIKYFEWQYGINAIKAQPAIGDVGFVIACTKDTQNPMSGIVGSLTKFSLANGIYIGGIKSLNQPATQTIVMDENGITITTPKTLTISTTENVVVNATGDATVNGANITVNATTKADVIAPEVNLGITGGKAIALDGDPVMAGSTVVGNIQASSTTTKSG